MKLNKIALTLIATALLPAFANAATDPGAPDLHELMRCWENIHRMYQAEAHVRSILFREETRWPGYYFRSDKPRMDEKNWHVFVNCRLNTTTGEWEMTKRPILHSFSKAGEHELLGG